MGLIGRKGALALTTLAYGIILPGRDRKVSMVNCTGSRGNGVGEELSAGKASRLTWFSTKNLRTFQP